MEEVEGVGEEGVHFGGLGFGDCGRRLMVGRGVEGCGKAVRREEVVADCSCLNPIAVYPGESRRS